MKSLSNTPFIVNDEEEIVGVKDVNDGEERLFVYQNDVYEFKSLITSAYNHTETDFTKGQVVAIAGAQGQRLTMQLAQANAESTSTKTFGILYEDVAKNKTGRVVTEGLITNIDTSALSEGVVWLSAATAGGITSTRPTAPNHGVFLGVCIRSHAINGAIFVKVQNGFELEELHNVLISNPQNGDVLKYNASTQLWYNAQP